MEGKELVSIIITTYKRNPAMVKRAVNSAINQSYNNIEIIIVDDSPSSFAKRDEVAKMVSALHDNRIIYIQHMFNKGACEARNTGIKKSRGNFILYFDDDDELLQTKIEDSLNKFNAEDLGLVYSQNFLIDENGNKKIERNAVHFGYVFPYLIRRNFVRAFPLIRKECFNTCGLFNSNMDSMQDYEMWLRMSKRYKFSHVEKPLSVVYHHLGERISTNMKNKINGELEIQRIYSDYLEKDKRAKNIRLLKLTRFYAKDSKYKLAIKTWFQAFKNNPTNIKMNFKYLLI